MPGTAIFDMDRTLTRTGTWSRYVFRVNKTRPTFYLRLPLLGLHAILYKLGLASRCSVKEHGLKTIRWVPRHKLEAIAEAFAEEEVRSGLRQRTLSVLEQHRRAGDRLVMATAAAELVARPIAKKLGIDYVICTELEWSADGFLTGSLSGENCYGPAKLDAVLAANESASFARPISAYSDHVSDTPFLEWADQPVAVNPCRGLTRIAAMAGFRVEDWESEQMVETAS